MLSIIFRGNGGFCCIKGFEIMCKSLFLDLIIPFGLEVLESVYTGYFI